MPGANRPARPIAKYAEHGLLVQTAKQPAEYSNISEMLLAPNQSCNIAHSSLHDAVWNTAVCPAAGDLSAVCAGAYCPARSIGKVCRALSACPSTQQQPAKHASQGETPFAASRFCNITHKLLQKHWGVKPAIQPPGFVNALRRAHIDRRCLLTNYAAHGLLGQTRNSSR